jgi:hypothetical protein
MPLFPGTGSTSERGVTGNIVNAPLKPGDGSKEFREAYESVILPALRRHAPDLMDTIGHRPARPWNNRRARDLKARPEYF